jgi:NtrC-family two-component system response regulator AlgB
MRILIIDDEANIRRTTALALETIGHETVEVSDGSSAKKLLEKQTFDIAFLDLKLGSEDGLKLLPELLDIEPQLVVIVATAFATIESAVEAIKLGAYDYIPKPFTPEQLRQVIRKTENTRRLEGRVTELESRLSVEAPLADFETTEPIMQKVYDIATKTAISQATVLILGESGTGKSILARAIHNQSLRRDHAFVTVSCPSLSKELLESELFGHVKGSFTGAVGETWGKVAAAEGGTLFLDEIGELPIEIQPKLLRLLQEKEYERVGSPKSRRANVRVIAASNRKLDQAVKEGVFREDLFYRLNVMSLEMPSLRQRMNDLPRMAENHLRFFLSQTNKKLTGFSKEATQTLRNYDWPGNLRELRNAIERAVILAAGPLIEVSDLPDQLQGKEIKRVDLGSMITLDELEREHIKQVISKTNSLEEAAHVLGIDPATLYRKRKRIFAEEGSPQTTLSELQPVA